MLFNFRISIIYSLILLVFSNSIYSEELIGWHHARVIAKNSNEYSIATVHGAKNKIFVISSGSEGAFIPDKLMNFKVVLNVYDGAKVLNYPVASVILPASQFQFALHPTVAVSEKKIVVAWQEPNTGTHGAKIRYAISGRDSIEFKEILIIKDKNDMALPHLEVDYKGGFHLFYQSKFLKSKGHYSIRRGRLSGSTFASFDTIITKDESIGRGAFFPAIVFDKKNVHLLYQSRQNESLKDEIYYIISKNLGKSFSLAERITSNSYNDFAPSAILLNGQLEWTWQADRDTGWDILYSPSNGVEIPVSDTNANSYNPVLVYTKKTGHIVAWYDQRVNPPQIYAKFLEKDKETIFGNAHPVTNGKIFATEPSFKAARDNVYLFYRMGRTVFSKKADLDTAKIKITSKTHPVDLATKSTKASFVLSIANEPSGVDSMAYVIDDRDNSNPDIYNLAGNVRKITKTGFQGGLYYLHIKYQDRAGNESKVYRYPFMVDTKNPEAPIVKSESHLLEQPSNNKTFIATLSSVDDTGIRGFWYDISRNIGDKTTKFQKKSNIKIDNLEPGRYFFIGRAEDKAGNLSPLTSYPIDIMYPDQADFSVITNIVNGRIREETLNVSISMHNQEKQILAIKGGVSMSPENPFSLDTTMTFDKEGNTYSGNLNIKELSIGFYVLNLGLEYVDGTKSYVRHYYFQKPPKEKDNYDYDVIAGSGTYSLSVTSLAKIKPEIIMNVLDNLYEVSIRLPKQANLKYSRYIKGFSYHLSDIPRQPSGEVNYANTPIYLYDLKPGIYYLTVIPVFTKKISSDIMSFAYVRFEINPSGWYLYQPYVYVALLLFMLILIYTTRKNISFFLSRFK